MLLHAFPLGYPFFKLVSPQVNGTLWADQPLLATLDLEPAALIALEITRPLKGAGLRALYLAAKVWCQLVGKDDLQIPMDPPEFMLAPHSMIDAEYNSWGSRVPYARRFLKGLDCEEFNITRLMPSLTVQVYAQSLLLLFFSFTLFVMTFNVENCNKRNLLSVSQLILHISFRRSMMALLRNMLCPIITMSQAIISSQHMGSKFFIPFNRYLFGISLFLVRSLTLLSLNCIPLSKSMRSWYGWLGISSQRFPIIQRAYIVLKGLPTWVVVVMMMIMTMTEAIRRIWRRLLAISQGRGGTIDYLQFKRYRHTTHNFFSFCCFYGFYFPQ